jgi:class 3 adenylate cyclase
VTYETVHRTILVLDIEGSGRPDRTDDIRTALHDKLYVVLETALEQASITPRDRTVRDLSEFHDRGDGVLVLVDPHVPKNKLLNLFVLHLAKGLRQHNNSASRSAEMRLRAAIHAGEIVFEQRGL